MLTQYNFEGVLECLFVNVNITEVETTELNDTGSSAVDLLVFPNPANTILNLVVNSENVTKIVLYDIAGNIVYIEPSLFLASGDVLQINTSFLTSGIYIISAQTESVVVFEKITIE